MRRRHVLKLFSVPSLQNQDLRPLLEEQHAVLWLQGLVDEDTGRILKDDVAVVVVDVVGRGILLFVVVDVGYRRFVEEQLVALFEADRALLRLGAFCYRLVDYYVANVVVAAAYVVFAGGWR